MIESNIAPSPTEYLPYLNFKVQRNREEIEINNEIESDRRSTTKPFASRTAFVRLLLSSLVNPDRLLYLYIAESIALLHTDRRSKFISKEVSCPTRKKSPLKFAVAQLGLCWAILLDRS